MVATPEYIARVPGGGDLGTVPRKARPPLWARKNAGGRLSNGIYRRQQPVVAHLRKMDNHGIRMGFPRRPLLLKLGILRCAVVCGLYRMINGNATLLNLNRYRPG
jgi:hypothetical protein